MTDAVPDSRYGWGMINPGAAVSRELPEETHTVPAGRDRQAAPHPNATGNRPLLLTVTVLIGLAAAIVLVLRIRRSLRAEPETDERPAEGEPGPGGSPPSAETPHAFVQGQGTGLRWGGGD
jgi:hypothetical protein